LRVNYVLFSKLGRAIRCNPRPKAWDFHYYPSREHATSFFLNIQNILRLLTKKKPDNNKSVRFLKNGAYAQIYFKGLNLPAGRQGVKPACRQAG